jgi:hypothetical protein
LLLKVSETLIKDWTYPLLYLLNSYYCIRSIQSFKMCFYQQEFFFKLSAYDIIEQRSNCKHLIHRSDWTQSSYLLQLGHFICTRSHSSKHALWKMCWHSLTTLTISIYLTVLRQMEHVSELLSLRTLSILGFGSASMRNEKPCRAEECWMLALSAASIFLNIIFDIVLNQKLICSISKHNIIGWWWNYRC